MSSAKKKKARPSIVEKSAYGANTAYLILHTVYLPILFLAGLDILAYVDIGVIAAYGLCFLMLKKKLFYPYTLVCGNIFLVFVSVATVLCGLKFGFFLTLIGLSCVAFYTAYFSKRRGVKYAIAWVFTSLAVFFGIYIYSKLRHPYYTASPAWAEVVLFSINSIVSFSLIAVYLSMFVMYTMSLEKRITSESRTDELTKINNRYGLYDHLDEIEDKSNCYLAIFDIDDFKKVNDTYGHVYGDFVLQEVSRRTASALPEDFLCRYGGEEFILILENELDLASVKAKLEALRDSIKKTSFVHDGHEASITITIGVAPYPKSGNTERWINAADEKMYQGKNSGKDQVVA